MVALTLLAFVLAPDDAEAGRKKKKKRRDADLINFLLSPGNSRWLSGPIARMASDDEVAAYLDLLTDDEAAAFIEEFWRRRDPHPATAANPVRDLFDERAELADKHYSEAGRAGRNTDRGTIYILYGQADETHYDLSSNPRDPPVETWEYSDEREAGLDEERPDSSYSFAKTGDVTTFYQRRPGTRLQRQPGSGGG